MIRLGSISLPNMNDAVLSEQVRLLYTRRRFAVLSFPFLVLLVAYVFREEVGATALAAWVSTVFAVTAAGIVIHELYFRKGAKLGSTSFWANLGIVHSALNGLAFGSAGILLYVPHSIPHQCFIVLFLGGICAAAISSSSSYLPAYLAFAIPTIVPVAARSAMDGDSIHLVMSVLISIFAGFMFALGRLGSRTIAEACVLHQEKEALAKDLAQSGKELEKRVEERTNELLNAVNALKESEERYRMLFDNAKDGIALADAETGVIIDCNQALCRMVDRDKRELIGQSQTVLHPPDHLDSELSSTFREHRERDTGRALEDRLMDRSGKLLEVEIRAAHIRMKERHFLLGIFRDITERNRAEVERKELEEKLRVSQKMEAIGSLAGGVAHDFNNLLSVILSYTSFAMEDLRKDDSRMADLVEVKKAAERAAALTRQLLAFSRKQVLQPVPLNLNRVAERVEKMLVRILGEDIDYVQKLDKNLGVVTADPGQIEQVLMNLAVNARDAMPRGGTLTVETSNVELESEHDSRRLEVELGPYVLLSVTDTGCGMDEQTRAKIFEPFFTTKERGKGTGLGLSTVYGIVKQSGGAISVESESGKGTSFRIYMPRELSARPSYLPTPSAIPRRVWGTETVLVVDDEEGLRKVAERALDSAGYTVIAASGGEEAITKSSRHEGEIHLLLTDVVMPKMNGRELANELLKERPDLKVLYMSGYTDDAIALHGALNPGTCFVEKPFTAADLTRKVREALNSNRA